MSKHIRLLTLNVFLRPPPIKTNQDDYKQERFQEIMKIIDQYDVVCFQEMFQSATFRPERIIQAAIKKKFYYWKISQSPSFLPGPVVDSGLMVLSKYPIVFSHFESYNIGILSDSASDKGYIYCKIKIDKTFIHLFVTHLQASYKLPGKQLQRQLSVKTRLYQFDILLQRIKMHLKKSQYKQQDLVLLAGDMNVDSNQVPYQLGVNSCLSRLQAVKKNKIVEEESNLGLDGQSFPEFVEFDHLCQLFQKHKVGLIDHAAKKYSGHPVTFGDGDVILTGQQDVTSRQSLDYIFTLQPDHNTTQTTLKCLTQTCQVQPFKFQQFDFGQLSDHYGMSITIT